MYDFERFALLETSLFQLTVHPYPIEPPCDLLLVTGRVKITWSRWAEKARREGGVAWSRGAASARAEASRSACRDTVKARVM
eukprot:768533-Hanusia_phi.AAC.4